MTDLSDEHAIRVSLRAEVLDRRPPDRRDQRRAALLRALDELLRERELDTITIAEIAARAGVTRSAFYFYFENRAACVAMLGSERYEKALATSERLFASDQPPQQRIQAMVSGLFAAWEGRQYLYRATLEASRTSATLRAIWNAYRESFVAPVAAMIEHERSAGRAPAGPDSPTLASLLLDLSDAALERLTPDDPHTTRLRTDALAAIWFRTIYAATGEDS